jgi:hypothetical protein
MYSNPQPEMTSFGLGEKDIQIIETDIRLLNHAK